MTKLEQALATVLQRYLQKDRNVDYIALMADKRPVKYAEALAAFDLSTLRTRNERLAFWINAYNALSIYGIVRKLESDPDFARYGHGGWLSRVQFFAIQKFTVRGKSTR